MCGDLAMKDIWNKDPVTWAAMPLVDRLELLRKWHCTGPCGQSASVIGTRASLDVTIREAQRVAEKANQMESVLMLLIGESLPEWMSDKIRDALRM